MLRFQCPHCRETGEMHPHRFVGSQEPDPSVDETLVSISADIYECGRCRLQSPAWVYVRRGAFISPLIHEDGSQIDMNDLASSLVNLAPKTREAA